MKKSVLFFTLIFLLCVTQNSLPQNISKKSDQIAVLEFEGSGISESESETLTDRFRSELVKTNAFIVLDRKRMKSILKEQAFQLSGCTSTECAVEAGKILNIEKIFIGKVGKVRRTYTIDISLIDIESSRIEKSFNRNHTGYIEGFLPILREIVFEMIPAKEGISNIPLYVSGIITIGSVGYGTYTFFKATNSYQNYKDALVHEDANKYKDDTKRFDNLTLISVITAGASTLFYIIYRQFYNNSLEPDVIYAAPYISDKNNYGLAINFSF
jgi:hypothetical protein